MNYNTPTRTERLRKNAIWLLADMLNALSRLAFRVGRVLSDASDRLVTHEFITRNKSIRN